MRKRLGLVILAGSLVCGAAHATTYPAIYSFGDSLSDAGNVRISTAGTYPKFPYAFGRFSNGLNWLDDLTAKVLGSAAAPATPSLADGNDFAFGGAQTGTTIVSDNPLVPTLDSQVQVFFKGLVPSPAPGALYTLDIGGNDILNAVTALKNGSISFEDMTTSFLNAAVANTVNAVKDLYADGMRSLLYYEVPDLAVVPDYKVLGAQFAADGGMLAKDFNTDVLSDIKALDLAGLTVFDVPTFSTIDKIVANPSAFGLTNVTDPCLSGDFQNPGAECSDPDHYLFWDGQHPTKVAHALTAELAFDVLNGTTDPLTAPEPSTWAMMLIGFAGLSFASWRARRAGAIA
jgi:phospholipase/lecithinase/hemolysin